MCFFMRTCAISGYRVCSLVVAVAACTASSCITLIGSKDSPSRDLRPIVSIDLRSSGYSLEKVVGDDNGVSFKLVEDKE